MNSKKEKELLVVDLFIEEYNSSISILTTEEAQKIFPKYNGENPDFIVRINEELIGVELFELTPDKFYTGIEGIQNNAHFAKTKGKHELIEIPDITDASIGQINKKMKKLNNYITTKIWLLGYAFEFYNNVALKCAVDDGLGEFIQGILKNITLDQRVEKIFLFERRAENILIDLLNPDSYKLFL